MLVRAVQPFRVAGHDVRVGQVFDLPDMEAADFMLAGCVLPAGLQTRVTATGPTWT